MPEDIPKPTIVLTKDEGLIRASDWSDYRRDCMGGESDAERTRAHQAYTSGWSDGFDHGRRSERDRAAKRSRLTEAASSIIATSEQLALLGNAIVVTNPTNGTTWRGRAIAIADHPSIVLEPPVGPRVTLPLAWAKRDPFGAPATAVDAFTPDEVLDSQARRIAELEKALEMTRRELDEAHVTMTELKTTQAGASQDFRDGAATGAAIVEVRLRTLESFGIPLTAEVAQQIAKAIRAEYGGAVNVESLT